MNALNTARTVDRILIIGFFCCLLALPFFIESFYASLLTMTFIYIIAAIGVNILTGYTGLVTVGHGGFFAIGAYTTALMGKYLHVSILPGLLAGGITSGIVGFLLGIIFLRLSGAFLAIGTLGFAFAIGSILNNWAIFEGREGISLPHNTLFGFPFGDVGLYYFCAITMIGIVLFAASLIRSSIGRAFTAVRDSERAAESSGINLRLYKTLSFTISAALTGMAGALFAHHTNYVSSETFGDSWLSVDFLVAVVVGGQASLAGSLLGGAFVVLLPYYLSEYRDFAFILKGVVLILVLLFAPAGLSDLLGRFYRKIVQWIVCRTSGTSCNLQG
jgi:branched-chain amino acid transport system permease protein